MKVYIVAYTCGDYYCGCPGGAGGVAVHIEGVYLHRATADQVAATVEGGGKEAWVVEADAS